MRAYLGFQGVVPGAAGKDAPGTYAVPMELGKHLGMTPGNDSAGAADEGARGIWHRKRHLGHTLGDTSWGNKGHRALQV